MKTFGLCGWGGCFFFCFGGGGGGREDSHVKCYFILSTSSNIYVCI